MSLLLTSSHYFLVVYKHPPTYTGAKVMKLLKSASALPRRLCPTFRDCRWTRSSATSPGMAAREEGRGGEGRGGEGRGGDQE